MSPGQPTRITTSSGSPKCLNNALRLETYVQDAERQGDNELADFFRKAQADSRKGADLGKQMLRKRLSA
jgi:hypothetical protein